MAEFVKMRYAIWFEEQGLVIFISRGISRESWHGIFGRHASEWKATSSARFAYRVCG